MILVRTSTAGRKVAGGVPGGLLLVVFGVIVVACYAITVAAAWLIRSASRRSSVWRRHRVPRARTITAAAARRGR